MRTYGRLILLAFFLLLGAPAPAWAIRAIGVPQAAPTAIFAAEAAVVTITTPIKADPDSSPISINLLRVNERGKSIGALGRLYDDGTHGDALAADHTFTGQFSFNEPNPTDIRLVVTVAYRGTLLRTRSQVFTIDVRQRTTSVERQPTMPDQPSAAQTCATLRSQIEVNAARTAILQQSLATEDSVLWLTMFVPSPVISQNNC
ncbi:MAG: choice-of-anchor X domain-containing protein [Pyrinomonadaceae bacterium]